MRLSYAIDALHPNDNTEAVNTGFELAVGETFFLRGGHANLFRENEKKSLASKGVVELRKGDILSFLLSGAGGYGSAALREKEAIEKDIEDGFNQVVIAASELGADAITVSGDILHSTRPTSRTMAFMAYMHRTLRAQSIPCYVISGKLYLIHLCRCT